MMQFTLRHTDTRTEARAGELATDHGVIRTPIFMPVGTAAAVKGIFHRDVRDEAGAEIILANTYHLYLRPGTKILEEAGGKMTGWKGESDAVVTGNVAATNGLLHDFLLDTLR